MPTCTFGKLWLFSSILTLDSSSNVSDMVSSERRAREPECKTGITRMIFLSSGKISQKGIFNIKFIQQIFIEHLLCPRDAEMNRTWVVFSKS